MLTIFANQFDFITKSPELFYFLTDQEGFNVEIKKDQASLI